MSFSYRGPNNTTYNCVLGRVKCKGKTKKSGRCSRLVRKGLPYCWQHMKSIHKVITKPSGIQAAGMGLFTCAAITTGSRICPYLGETLTQAEIDARYGVGNHPAPYAWADPDDANFIVDSACYRSMGALANDAAGSVNVNNANIERKIIPEPERIRLNKMRAPGAYYQKDRKYIFVTATRNIAASREVFVDYTDNYWEFANQVSSTTRGISRHAQKCPVH